MPQIIYCQTTEELRRAYRIQRNQPLPYLAIDTETSGRDPFHDRLILVQAGTPELVVMADARRIPHKTLFAWLDALLGQAETLVFHNYSFDAKFLLVNGSEYLTHELWPFHDTMLAERLLIAGKRSGADLETVAKKYLGVELDKTLRKCFLSLGDDDISPELLAYSASDVFILEPIVQKQLKALAENQLESVFRLELHVARPAAEASLFGVQIDVVRWRAHLESVEKEAKRREAGLLIALNAAYTTWKERHALPHEYLDWGLFQEALGLWESQFENEYLIVLQRAAQDRADWRRWYEDRQKADGRRSAAEWRKKTPEPGDGKGQGRKAQRAWALDHPKPRYIGGEINIGSSEQLSGALLQLGVPLPKSRKGKYQTNALVLNKLKRKYDICAQIGGWRKYAKLVESFGESVLSKTDNGLRLHAEFNTMGTETGRFTCSRPNIQQMPANEEGGEFRNCFIAGPGRKLVSVDYSQIELRILAELSGEENLLWAFDNGVDLHSLTALRMFKEVLLGVFDLPDLSEQYKAERKTGKFTRDWDEVCRPYLGQVDTQMKAAGLGVGASLTFMKKLLVRVKKEFERERAFAKRFNFGIPYGQTKYGFSDQMSIEPEEAQVYLDAYFAANPKVLAWLGKNAAQAFKVGYARTPLGRKRFIAPPTQEELHDQRKLRTKQNRDRRAMNNMPIQAASADITKIAIVLIRQALLEEALDARQVLFVHDEIVVECSESVADRVLAIVKDCMVRAARTVLKRTPADVSGEVSDVWKH